MRGGEARRAPPFRDTQAAAHHVFHGRHAADIPGADVLIEGRPTTYAVEDIFHARHATHIPVVDRAVCIRPIADGLQCRRERSPIRKRNGGRALKEQRRREQRG